MAAITADGRQELVALYITMFDRAPTTLELAQMVQAREAGSTLAQVAANLSTNVDFALVASKDADSFATYLADALLASDTPASARAWAINWVVTNVSGTKSKAQVIAEAVQAIRATTNTNYTTAKAILTTEVTNALTAIDNPAPVNTTTSLTVSATDVVNGGTGADTIIGQLGQSVTLQASDNVNGGAGADTLRVVSDGAAAQTAGGFTVNNVETLEVQAQATGGTTLSLENVTGVTTIRSSSSNGGLVLDQVKAIAGLEVVGALGAQPLEVKYQTAATSGTADVQNLALNGNALGALTINGIETLAVTTNTASSTVASITGTAFKTVTVAGDKSLKITAALPATVTSVDASAQTAGGTNVTLTNAADVAVKGGAGADTVTFTGAFTSADSFDGGAGTDTIVANVAEFTANTYSAAAKISNVEVIQFADALTTAFDASKISGETTYSLKTFTGPVTISKAEDSSTLTIRESGSTGTLTYSIGDGATLATATGTANTVTLNVGTAGTNGGAIGTVDLSGVETVKIASSGSSTTAGANTLTVVDAAATSVTLSGSEDLTLTMTGTALTSLDASAATGAVDVSLVTYKAATAATITGGSGNDKINGGTAGDTINGGAGADAIAGAGGADNLTGGAGIDTFFYSAVSDSSGSTQDTITDFVSGTDLINLQTLAQATGRTNIVLKNGAATDFGNAQSSIALNSGNTQVVFQADTNTLWVDLNDDGTLNNNDLAVKLTGVTKIVAADIGGTASPGGSGNYITLNSTTTAVTTTTSTGATGTTTAFGDTITSTAANVTAATASVNGDAGTDTLVLTTALTAAIDDGIINIETLQLANAANTTVAFNDKNTFLNLTGNAGVDTVNTTDLIEGGTVSLGDGADVLTLNAFEDSAAADTSVKFNIDMGAGDDSVTTGAALTLTSSSTLAGGAGTDTLTAGAALNIKDGNVSGFEVLATGGFAVTLTAAQYATFTSGATGAGAITFSDSAAAADVSASTATTYALNAAGQTFTGNAAVNYVITGGAANDKFVIKAGWTGAGDAFDGAGGTGDTFEIAYDVAGAIDLTAAAGTLANVENLVISAAQSADYTLTLDAALVTADLSAAGTTGKVTTVVATNAGMTSLKLGAGNDVITTVTANTAATTIELGAGNDTITALNVGNFAMTLNSGTGNLTITDIAAHGTGALTLKFDAPTTGTTIAANVAATTANIAAGDIFDFASNVTAVITGAANGTLGVAGGTGQVFIDDQGANIVVTFDADGNRTFSAGDVQITLIAQDSLAAGIDANGNLLIA